MSTTAAVTPAPNTVPSSEKGAITTDQFKASQDQLNAKLNDPSVRQDIRAELQRMGENVVGIETNFAEVASFLKRLDDTGALLDKNGKVMLLSPEWQAMHDEYTTLMNKSQATAVEVNVQISDLLEVFVPYIESKAVSGPKKEKKLGQYIDDLAKFVVDGTSHGNAFLRLREKVVAFQQKLHQETKGQLAGVEVKLKDLNTNIKKIEEELKLIGEYLNKSWYKVGNTEGITGLINLAPKSLFPIITGVFSVFGSNTIQETISKTAQKAEKEKKLQGLKKERSALHDRKGNLEDAIKALDALDNTFASLVGRLAAMEGIWRMLTADAIALKEKLNKINNQAEQKKKEAKPEDYDEEDEAFFLSLQLASVKTVYSTLRLALDAYALAVAPAQTPRK